jgi:hypothetical protein
MFAFFLDLEGPTWPSPCEGCCHELVHRQEIASVEWMDFDDQSENPNWE